MVCAVWLTAGSLMEDVVTTDCVRESSVMCLNTIVIRLILSSDIVSVTETGIKRETLLR